MGLKSVIGNSCRSILLLSKRTLCHSEQNLSSANKASCKAMDASSSPSTCTNKKVLYGIRHAHSEANEWMSQPGNKWGNATFCDDASLVDARLSERGQAQVQELAVRLANASIKQQELPLLAIEAVELVVVSPLTRCLQTWQDGCQKAFALQQSTPPVLALPLASERVYTSSDTGRPTQQLAEEYPDVDFSECYAFAKQQDGAEWWYTSASSNVDDEEDQYEEWRPHGKGQYYAVSGEPYNVFERRMNHLQAWLQNRPEQCILLVCHWGVLRYLTSGKSVKNCDVVRMQLGATRRAATSSKI